MEEQKLKVIIVDDHKMIRETWRFLLSRDARLEVVGECASGAEAISSAAQLLPNIILMDINMEPVNGFEATLEISKNHPDINIIGVSVNDQPGYARHMLQMGARGFVTKNSSLTEMVHAIMEVSQGRVYICNEVRDKME